MGAYAVIARRSASDDVDAAVRLAVATVRAAADADWNAQAGPTDWTAWEVVDHVADNLFFFAAQLSPRTPTTERQIPFAWSHLRAGDPGLVIHADRRAGPAGLAQVVDACGGLLVAVLRTAPPGVLARNEDAVLDADGFAAVAIGEVLVHMSDAAAGLGVPWEPPPELCDRVLARLFPDAPADTDRWPTLLWATGRGELPGRPRVTEWDWHADATS